MVKRKKGYASPEMQLSLCREEDFICTSGEVNWETTWGVIPDNQFSGDGN